MKIKLKNSEQFKETIIKSGYSIRSFAKEVDISGTFGNQVVNGERYPSPRTAKKICDLLNVEFDDIFFIDNGCNCNQNAVC